MAKKGKSVFYCTECGHESPRWVGQCICGAWNTLVEEKVSISKEDIRRRSSSDDKGKNKVKRLRDVEDANHTRIDTYIKELNRVLGGGLVKGSLTLISGEPGIGKSTIILEAASNIAKSGKKVLYISGEESSEQIKMRADRICCDISENLYILAETNMEAVMNEISDIKPDFLIIDSIQTMYTEEIDSVPGSVSQVRACGNMIMKIGKEGNIPIFIVAHVTKSGELAGPKIVEHLVDTVLSFAGERNHELRILRAYKNRFGTTSEIGAFKMTEEGLVEIKNLSETFIDTEERNSDSIVTSIYEGTRPVLLEVQSLTTSSGSGFPRRSALGIEQQRLNMLLAVLEKKAGVYTSSKDVYVSVVGGYKLDSTAADLAILLSIYSTMKDIKGRESLIVLGEVGLTGEVRSIQHIEKILLESYRMGYKNAIIPERNFKKLTQKDLDKIKGMNLIKVKDIREAIKSF